MTIERIEIEDTSDCRTCERRESERFELFCEVKLRCAGNAWCQECGREFAVMIEGEQPPRKES